jgi:hypothetical protein
LAQRANRFSSFSAEEYQQTDADAVKGGDDHLRDTGPGTPSDALRPSDVAAVRISRYWRERGEAE